MDDPLRLFFGPRYELSSGKVLQAYHDSVTVRNAIERRRRALDKTAETVNPEWPTASS